MTHRHPHVLHATAALWSLRAARRHLHDQIAAEARAIALDPADGLRSPRYGSRGASGGHSDPTAGALITATRHASRWENLDQRTTDTLTWLATKLGAHGPGDPLGRLHNTIPTLRPAAAHQLHRWLADLDQRLRRATHLAPSGRPLPGLACPSCGIRQLHLQDAATDRTLWTVVCHAGCRCAGAGCTCAMPVLADGVQHIWSAGSGHGRRWIATVDS